MGFAMPDSIWRLLPSKIRSTIHPEWRSNSNLEMQVPLTAQTDRNGKPLGSLQLPQSTRAKAASILGLRKRAVEKHLGSRFTGWRFGVLNFAILASVVLLINFVAMVSGLAATSGAKGVFFDGDCDRVKRLNTGLHLGINILSTILLAGSNYTMQCLSAPTRSEVDSAHSRKPSVYLDVGVPGIRNLRHISRRRAVLWAALGLSSLPLHLFYNSAVFGSISSNSYWVFSVGRAFLDGENCTNCTEQSPQLRTSFIGGPNRQTRLSASPGEIPSVLESLWEKARAGNLEKLEPNRCIDEYATSIQSNHRNLLLVSDDSFFPPSTENKFINGSHIYWGAGFDAYTASDSGFASNAYHWMCSASHDLLNPCSVRVQDVKKQESWQVGWLCDDEGLCDLSRTPVEYCLSEPAQTHCKLHFEPTITTVITILNLFKACLMFYVVFFVHDEPLMTMGDAVVSFLENEDVTTKDMCLSTLADFRHHRGYQAGPRQWRDGRYHWKDVTSITRRIVVVAVFLLALAIVGFLLKMGIEHLPTGATFDQFSFGAVDPRTAISYMPPDLITNVVIANTPQLALSFLYFSYNALFTAMLMGYEWVSYSGKRKGLRVTHQPAGAQRSTYFLQLPYRFGIPLMVLSGTLHWLVSQSIFLIAIDFYDPFGKPGTGSDASNMPLDYKTLGYSPPAIISVIVLGGLMVISIVAFGYTPYKRGMPIVGSCSMAISAACHPAEQVGSGENIAEKKLQWGVVSTGADGLGHCAFSAEDVGAVVEGKMYGGHSL